MNLEEGHWRAEAANMSSVAEGFSLTARQDLLLDTRQDLSFSAVQSWDTKCFLFLFSLFLFFSLCHLYNERLEGARMSFYNSIRNQALEKDLVEGQAMPLGVTHKNHKIK